MNDMLYKMAVRTMYKLESEGALPTQTNSAERRYAADYIVKKSAFAPFFAKMGITRGCQIGRSFDVSRSVHFFSAVTKLYYMYTLMPEELENRSIESIFKSKDWKYEEFWITRMFGHMSSLLYTWMWGNMGEGPEERNYFGRLQKSIMEAFNKSYSAPIFLFQCEPLTDPVTLAAVSSAYEWQKDYVVIYYMAKKSRIMHNELMQHGTARDTLKRCVGRNVDPYQADPTITANLTGGRSLLEIDHDAAAYLSWLRTSIYSIENFQLVPDSCKKPVARELAIAS